MPATLTSRVELLLFDPTTQKPKHGERARITTQLWENYLAQVGDRVEDGTHILTLPRSDDCIFELEGMKLTYSQLLNAFKEKASV